MTPTLADMATQLVRTTDSCTRCQQVIASNAQWSEDQPYCPICALDLVVLGRRFHGSRIQGRFWDAADRHLHPADRWLWEEFGVVLSGRSFRADFAVRLLPAIKIAVELDSQVHHSSKEARERDYQRERLFQADGWTVVRFTGSQVWRDPDGCIRDLIGIIRAVAYGPSGQFSAAA